MRPAPPLRPPPDPRRERARARRVAAAGEQGPMPCAAARQGARLRRPSRCPPLRHKLTTHFQTATALVAKHRALLAAPRVTALVTAPRRGPCSVAAPSRSRHVLNTRPARRAPASPAGRGGAVGAAGERSGGARPSAPLAPSQVTCSPAARAPLLALSLLVLSRTLVRSTSSSSPVGPWLPLPAAHRGTPSLLFLFETDDSFLAGCKRGGKQVLLFNPHENTPPRRELLLVSRPRSQRPPGHLPYARHSAPPPPPPRLPKGGEWS